MNLPLPRRPSGRRTRPDCPGHQKRDGGADRDPEHAAYMSWVTATVGEHGWAISGRHGDEEAPPWAYSVGMWVSYQAPELVMCGLPVDNAAAVINAVGARMADGVRFGADDVLDAGGLSDALAPLHRESLREMAGAVPSGSRLLAGGPPAALALRPVDLSWRATDGLLGISNAFYGLVRPSYLQIVWSDGNGTFPWERGFQPAFDRMQPLLWLPRDDNPPSPWTRLDRLA